MLKTFEELLVLLIGGLAELSDDLWPCHLRTYPSRISFAWFFSTALSHVQNSPYYVPFSFMGLFYVQFCSVFSPLCDRRNPNCRTVNDHHTKTKQKFLLTATVRVVHVHVYFSVSSIDEEHLLIGFIIKAIESTICR